MPKVLSVVADDVDDAVGDERGTGPAGGHSGSAVAGVLCADPPSGLASSDIESFLPHRSVSLPALVAEDEE